jgi:hypothetical protein
MYDMYPWDKSAEAKSPDPATPAVPAESATRAVQVSLDRRDNGGSAPNPASVPAADPAGQ